jgi:hypothetical protein
MKSKFLFAPSDSPPPKCCVSKVCSGPKKALASIFAVKFTSWLPLV